VPLLATVVVHVVFLYGDMLSSRTASDLLPPNPLFVCLNQHLKRTMRSLPVNMLFTSPICSLKAEPEPLLYLRSPMLEP
jgi:hypothetical protein